MSTQFIKARNTRTGHLTTAVDADCLEEVLPLIYDSIEVGEVIVSDEWELILLDFELNKSHTFPLGGQRLARLTVNDIVRLFVTPKKSAS